MTPDRFQGEPARRWTLLLWFAVGVLLGLAGGVVALRAVREGQRALRVTEYNR